MTRPTNLLSAAIGTCAIIVAAATATPAVAQNDWQYPDPYFGILEIEKSHDAATRRRYRAEVGQVSPSNEAAATQPPAAAPAAATTRTTRQRWRQRWRSSTR
jgi:hypothetical protein